MPSDLRAIPCRLCGERPDIHGNFEIGYLVVHTCVDGASSQRFTGNDAETAVGLWNQKNAAPGRPMQQSDPAAPAWPDEVVEAVAAVIERETGINCLMCERIARASSAAMAPHVAAREQAAERRGIERAMEALAGGLPTNTHAFCILSVAEGLRRIAALTPPATAALDAHVATRVAEAVAAERMRIIAGVRAEADTTPYVEDQRVVEDVADLIEADFDYKAAEKLHVTREAADQEPGHD